MSSGADHYREAERLLDDYAARMEAIDRAMTARADRDGGGPSAGVRQDIGLAKMLLNEAQVHATLAQADAETDSAALLRAWVDGCNGDYPPRIGIAR